MRWLVALAAIAGCHSTRAPAPVEPTASITVYANWPGASATTIAASVTAPLERQFAQLAKLDEMTSRSVRGETTISLGFAGTPLDAAAREVQQAINAATSMLPQTMPTPPTYRKVGDDAPVLRLVAASDVMTLDDVAAFSDALVAQKLAQVTGVGEVAVCGARSPFRVEIDLVALAGTHYSIEDVLADVAHRPAPTLGSASTTPWFERGPIVRDVADVQRDGIPACAAFAAGKRAITLAVRAQPSADRGATRTALDALLPVLARQLPPGVELRALPDDLTDAYEVVTSSDVSSAKRYELERQLAPVATLVELGVDRRGERAPTTIAIHASAAERPAIERAMRELPDVELHTPGAIVVELQGPDLAALHDALAVHVAALRAVGIVVQGTRGDDRARELVPAVDRDTMARLGIGDDVAVAHALALLQPEGIAAGSIATQGAITPIVVVAREPSIDRIYVNRIPISAFVTLQTKLEPTVVLHRGQFPAVAVLVDGSRDALDAALATIKLPDGVVRHVQP